MLSGKASCPLYDVTDDVAAAARQSLPGPTSGRVSMLLLLVSDDSF